MSIITSLVSKTGRMGLLAKKYSPQLLIGFGSVTFIETVVVACVNTTRASEVLDRHQERMAQAKEAEEVALPEDNYDIRKEKAVVYAHTAADMAKAYAPTIGLGALTLTCFFKAFGIMNARYTGAVAAYNLVSTAFDNYRDRVKKEMGESADRHFLYGTETDTIEITTFDGKKEKTEKEKVESIDSKNVVGYSAVFDRRCSEWDPNYIYNLKWLRANETAANDILQSRGHIFLNEVYDMIGLPHTPAGAVAGWIRSNKDGDGYVSFGLDDPDNESAKKLINGEDNVVLLDFNVDGIIFDKI